MTRLEKLSKIQLLEIIDEQQKIIRNTSDKALNVHLQKVDDLLLERSYRRRFRSILVHTVFNLIVVTAIAVLIAVYLLPVLRIQGHSMTPNYQEKDIVLCSTVSKIQEKDIIAFYYNNKVLVKRVIASAGEWVDIDEMGNVYVDEVLIEEPYISEKSLGVCDIVFPFQVPDGSYFVMGDHRETSLDSRSQKVGCVKQEAVVGEVKLKIWPWKVGASE